MADFIISQEDWSLHRKGYDDQKRHEEKITEAIKNNLHDLVTEEQFISYGKDITLIPVKSLEEYKIIYNYNKTKHVGMGNGNSKIGDTIADEAKAMGKGSGGLEEGEDWYEAEISLSEIENVLFEELELPNLEKKQAGLIETESYEFNDIRRIGITGNIHKKRSLMAAFKRNSLKGKPSFYPVYPEDLRYRAFNEVKKPDIKAVIFAMMDTSGSMGIWEKYMARSTYFWIQKFLKTKYESVEIEFIAHHTEAKVVSEHQFYHKGESGGTICSSAYRKALELTQTKYPPSQYNIYVFHASDGDNLTSDNARCVKFIEKLIQISCMFGYIEVNQYNRHSTLMTAFKKIKNEKFRHYVLRQKADVFYAIKSFFRKENEKCQKQDEELTNTWKWQ